MGVHREGFRFGSFRVGCVASAAMPGAKDKDAPLPVVPVWLKRKGDEAIYDVRHLIKDCLKWHSCVVKIYRIGGRISVGGGGNASVGVASLCQDIRSNPACTARARTGSVIAYPVKEGDINEKTLKCNNDLLNLHAWFVKKYPKLYKSVALQRAVLADCAKYWKSREGDEAFEYRKWKARV